MKNIILCSIFIFLLGCFISLPIRNISEELDILNSKIDKIVIFLDLELNNEEEAKND